MVDTLTGYAPLIAEIRALYGPGPIPLHRPVFEGPERRWLVECIDSNFVSSVGAQVTAFEERIAAFTRAGFAVATVNGTAALHIALHLAGVRPEEEVITQALTFVATCNATRYCGAWPVFVDVDRDTLGLSPVALAAFLDQYGERRADGAYNRAKRAAPGGLRADAYLRVPLPDRRDRGDLRRLGHPGGGRCGGVAGQLGGGGRCLVPPPPDPPPRGGRELCPGG